MNFRVTHSTRYQYSEPVGMCWNEACLLPRETSRQICHASRLQIEPAPVDVRERVDFFGNRITHFAIQKPHDQLAVTAVSDLTVVSAPDLRDAVDDIAWETVRDRLMTERRPDILEALSFRYASPMISESQQLAEYANLSFTADRPLVGAATELMQRIYQDFSYESGATTIATPLSEVLATRRGVCQDFAHLGIACVRSMGLAARYVSGYIETLPPPGKERLVGADASHAWFSVFCGEAGWIDFDPTNNRVPVDQHITVAWGRDYADVSPLRGVALGGGKHKVIVSVDVARTPAVVNSPSSQHS
jgi:transglutaminase-like putative cysteine protease